MGDELLTYARELVQRADQDEDERARQKAEFMRDFEALPLMLRLRVLRMMCRRAFGTDGPGDD